MQTINRNMHYRRKGTAVGSAVLTVLFVLLLIVQLPMSARADDSRVGIDVFMSGSTTSEISAAGIDIEVRDADTDEFSAVGVDVIFEGRTSGDVSIAAVDTAVIATVGGDLAVVAAEMDVRADVAGHLSLAGADVTFEGTAASAEIAGADVSIGGAINGDLNVAADDLTFAPGTVVNGNFSFEGPEEPVMDGLTVGGTYTYEYRNFEEWADGEVPVFMFPVVALAGITGAFFVFMMLAVSVLIGGGLLLLLMTGLTARTIDGIRQKPLSSFGMGIVVLIGLLLIAALLCVTVIGIPLAFAIIAFYPVLLLVGFVIATLGIPYLIIRQDPRRLNALAKIGLFFLSIMILLVVLSVLPMIGPLIFGIAVLMGVGAFGAALLGGREDNPAAAA